MAENVEYINVDKVEEEEGISEENAGFIGPRLPILKSRREKSIL